jgi:hypothetical protein
MKEFFLRREGMVRLISLMIIAISVFVDEKELKIGALMLGIFGLVAISAFKKQKVMTIVYFLLMVVAAGVVYYKM